MPFRPISDHELDALSDDELIAYIRAARDAGQNEAGKHGLQILVFGRLGDIERRMKAKLPAHAPHADIAHDIMVRAITAAFDGQSVGEFHSWLNTITRRAVADWYRTRERRPEETPLAEENADDEDIWSTHLLVESEAGAVELRLLIDDVLAPLSETHRLVIELHVFAGLKAGEVCERIDGMSEPNVNQIASRFRKHLRERLEPDGTGT